MIPSAVPHGGVLRTIGESLIMASLPHMSRPQALGGQAPRVPSAGEATAMADLDKALQTQIANLQSRSGRSLEELFGLLRASRLEKHGQLRDYLKTELGMGAGDANTVVHLYLNPDAMAPKGHDAATAALDAIYDGPKAGLRSLHDAVMAGIGSVGEFEIAPKQGYVSLVGRSSSRWSAPARMRCSKSGST
jgi:hypothetical protein